jgi:hypothetical protein
MKILSAAVLIACAMLITSIGGISDAASQELLSLSEWMKRPRNDQEPSTAERKF